MSEYILVIDDEESIRFTFHRFLTNAGYRVETAESFDEACDLLETDVFDLVYADIVLHDGTGMDVLKKIKSRDHVCPVIMITGDPGPETAVESLRLGAFDYIPKPVNQEALLIATRTALKFKAATEEKEKYRVNIEAVFRSVRDSIVTVDREMSVVELNDAAMDFFGCTRDHIGKPFFDLVGTEGEKWGGIMNDALKSRNPVDADRVEFRSYSQRAKVLNIRAYPLVDIQKNVSGLVMVLRDETHVVELERQLGETRQFHRMVGHNRLMQKVYSMIKTLADVKTTVLITGESGTGKELAAEALHLAGDRSKKPMVTVNCSALSENLLESELFGHVKGAFTGAVSDNTGRFSRAEGGTLFLDEIGDISPAIQLKLLRVLDEGVFEKVGSSVPIRSDVRLIAATNNDLGEKVRQGKMRQDLYYRLKVVEIPMPPLRERPDDIPFLVDHFLRRFNGIFKKSITGLSYDVHKIFISYAWPGNVRELIHALEHAFVLCRGDTITKVHLPNDIMDAVKKQLPMRDASQSIESLLEALEQTDWNKAKAARILRIDRATVYRKIERFKLIPKKPQT